MKKLTALLLLYLWGYAEPLQIKGVKKEYQKGEKINYTIFNKGEHTILINIAVEALINNHWQEVEVDATRNTTKSALVYQLNENGSRAFVFETRYIDKALFKNKQATIRLKVYCKQNALSTSRFMYSTSILVYVN